MTPVLVDMQNKKVVQLTSDMVVLKYVFILLKADAPRSLTALVAGITSEMLARIPEERLRTCLMISCIPTVVTGNADWIMYRINGAYSFIKLRN